MNPFVTQFAAESSAKPGLFEALGIDWKQLVLQTIAFLILLYLLKRFAYPPIIKSIDARQATIDQGLAEAKQSHEALTEAEAKIEAMLAEARQEADGIVSRGTTEANTMVAEAEDKAKVRAERIVADARTQLESDIAKARLTLKQDTMQLVALATERIIHEKVDTKKDAGLIEHAISGKAKDLT